MLELKHIQKSFDGSPVLKDISIQVEDGEIVSILGPSGCGKTTLLNLILGITQADGGSIVYNGEDLTHAAMEKRGFNIVFQDYALFPNLNVYQNVTYGLKNKPDISTKEEVEELIALLGLIIMAFILFSTGGDTQTMKYSEVIDYFEQGKVSEFVLNMKNGAMQLTLTEEATQELLEQQPGMTLGGQQTGALGGLWGGSSSGAASDTAKQAVLTYTLPYAGELLDKDNLQRYREIYAEKNGGAELKMDLLPATETPVWLTMLPMLLISVLLMAGFYYFMYKQSGGGGAMNVGRAKVKDQAEQGRKATFKDVAGADEEKEELQEAGCSLGTGDRAMQKANLDRYEARLVQRIAELQKGLPERKRLCQSLGIMGGLFLFLILV